MTGGQESQESRRRRFGEREGEEEKESRGASRSSGKTTSSGTPSIESNTRLDGCRVAQGRGAEGLREASEGWVYNLTTKELRTAKLEDGWTREGWIVELEQR
jgi:hypothetical protein